MIKSVTAIAAILATVMSSTAASAHAGPHLLPHGTGTPTLLLGLGLVATGLWASLRR